MRSENSPVDQAIERFLVEYLREEKGRANKTVNDYRKLHARWFSPTIGSRRVGKVDTATMDRLFGRMRKAGLSASRLNQAKSLYGPFFRWAKRRGMTTRDPMADFQKPTSSYRSTARTPPEVGELSLMLAKSVEVVPRRRPPSRPRSRHGDTSPRAEAGRRWNRHNGMPVGTLIVNVTGPLLLGLLVNTAPPAVTVLGAGCLGAYTTFSSFARDTVALIEQGRVALAAVYVGAMLTFGIAAAAIGVAVAG